MVCCGNYIDRWNARYPVVPEALTYVVHDSEGDAPSPRVIHDVTGSFPHHPCFFEARGLCRVRFRGQVYTLGRAMERSLHDMLFMWKRLW